MIARKFILLCFCALIFSIGCTSPVESDSRNSGQQSNGNSDTKSFFTSLEQALPTHTSQDQIIHHMAYTLKYNEEFEQAEWVAYPLTRAHLNGSVKRTDNFRADPAVITGSAELVDYKGSDYDRGHLAPAADMSWSEKAMSESFFFSNMSPQVPGFNRGIWSTLESYVRTWANENDEIFVVTGPVLTSGLPTIGPNQVSVPSYYYKVILDCKEPVLKGIGFILPNSSSKSPLQNSAVTIDSVESFTGIDFFPGLPDSVEKAIESSMDLSKWAFAATNKGTGKETPQAEPNTPPEKNVNVYITKSGTKYHRAGCRYLSKSKFQISLEDVIKRGYEPCGVCKPPQYK